MMTYKNIILFFLATLSVTPLIRAQQEASFSLYMFNHQSINPAYVGIGSTHFPLETVALVPSKVARVAKRENFIIFTFLIFLYRINFSPAYKSNINFYLRGSIYDFVI